jgi:hypothetical protein
MSITSVINDTVTSVSFVNAQKPLPPTISGYSVGGLDDTALDPAGGQTVQINGTGFLAGATITFDGSAVAVVTFSSANRLTFTSPAKSAGTYTIYVVNPDGGTAIYIPGIIYSVLPTWTTSAGTLGSYYETTSISNTVIASGDAPITYSLYSGSLPTGSTLYANGVITGTAPVDSSSTTYSFTIQATDAQLQDSTRSFSLTINVDAVTWVSPANNTTYTSAVDSAISNVALSATDAAGYAVSYSANALPTGLTLTGSNIAGTPTVIADSSTLLTATAATTNRSAVRTINWSITVANDPYFEYNTLLIPGASTTFVDDASTNNFAVTINGDTKPNSFNPYTPGYYSNYFDGSGDRIVLSGSNFSLTGDFTLEAWVYIGSLATTRPIVCMGDDRFSPGGLFAINTSGKLYLFASNTAIFTGTGTSVVANSWTHVAFVRSGSTITGYVNGVVQGTSTSAISIGGTASYIGYELYNSGTGVEYLGNISNLRIVNGTAVYTSAFTPSTTPLTAISGTILLTCQSNTFVDNSSSPKTLTVVGNTLISSFDPFVPNSSYSTYGSGYFDGNDYLDVPINSAQFGTGAFTIDFWVYPTTLANTPAIIDFRSSVTAIFGQIYIAANGTVHFYLPVDIATTNTVTVNTWNHVAISRTAGTLKMFINGVSGYSSASTGTYNASAVYIGVSSSGSGGIVGYLSDMRFVIGTGVYTTDFTPPSAPLTAIANTSLLVLQNNQSVNNSVFLDNSTNNFLVTRAGNTTQGTFSPYGGNWSNYFDGASDYIRKAGAGVLTASGDVTIECWIYPLSSTVIGLFDGGPNEGDIMRNWPANRIGKVAGSDNPTFTVTANQWQHFACTFSSGNIKVFINGTLNASGTYAGGYSAGSNFDIGTINAGGDGSFNGYISNFRVTKSILYTTTFTPSTTPLTPITNTSLLTCQSNRIIDTSINNFTITKNGDVSVQRFSPFNPSSLTPTSYSGYFDGSGDYLTAPANAAYQFGTGDFTIEYWIYQTVSGSYRTVLDTRTSGTASPWACLINSSNQPYILITSDLTSSIAININAWNHVAIVRSGTNLSIYVNGVSGLSTTNSTNISPTGSLRIGLTVDAVYPIIGYLSNIRIVKGTAVYTGAFTPPTSPLTAIANTSLLTCQSPTFIDNSTNNFTITAFGNSQPTQQNPFGFTSATTNGYTVSTIGGSGYFDGTGDTLSVPANPAFQFTGNYTIEFWIYFTSVAGVQDLVANYVSSAAPDWTILIAPSFQYYPSSAASYVNGPTPVANRWYHVAAVRSGTTCSLYIDGVSVGTPLTFSGTLGDATRPVYIGSRGGSSGFTLGYMSDVRIVRGTAVYTSNFVPPSAPLTAVQNTSLLTNMTSAGIYDAAMMNNMETVGNAQLSTAISKFGGSSMYFDGTGDYLSLRSNPLYAFGTGDFTIEGWLYLTTNQNFGAMFISSTTGTGDALHIQISNANKVRVTNETTQLLLATNAISLTTWTHIAVVRSGTTLAIYQNGILNGSTTNSTSFIQNGAVVGYEMVGGNFYYTGYIDDLRITKGYARYTSNFTPPTSAFPIY